MQDIDIEARLLALRLVVEPLWATILAAQADPIAACRRVAEQGSRNIERSLEGLAPSLETVELVQRTVSHHEDLWNSIEQRLRRQVG